MDFTRARLKRQAKIFGGEMMERIKSAHLAVIGCGRNGSSFAIFSAYSGFSRFSLIDFDVVKPHNLNATLGFFKADIGRKKCEVVAEKLKLLDPFIEAEAVYSKAEDAIEPLEKAGILVDATDSIKAKLFLNSFASAFHKKGQEKVLISLGSGAFVKNGRILQLGSQASLYRRGGACLLCGPLNESERTNLSRVSFIALNAFSSLLGLQLLLSFLSNNLHLDNPDFILYDFLSHKLIALHRSPRPDCIYCGRPASKA